MCLLVHSPLNTLKKFIDVLLIYNVVLITAVQQSDPVSYIYICVCVCVYIYIYTNIWASLVAQVVKNPPTMQETPVQFLGLGRSPGEGVGYPPSILGLPRWFRG